MSLRNILNTLPDKISKNFPVKLISLVIAVLLWFYLKNFITTSYEFYVPLNYQGLYHNRVILNHNNLPKYVLMRVKGSKDNVSRILDISRTSIYAFVDLSVTNQKNLYKVNISLPEEMKKLQVDIHPKEVFVDIDEIVETNLPVVVKNSADYIVIPSNIVVRTISRNLGKLPRIEIEVDTTKNSDKISLENTTFLTFSPQVVFVSNTNK